MYYHLVLIINYRKEVFHAFVSIRAREIFDHIAPDYNITLLEWNHDIDHVHILFKEQPNSVLSKFINTYKSISSRLLKRVFRYS